MRVAKTFRSPESGIDWIIETNNDYVDAKTGTAREIDLSAYTNFCQAADVGINVGAEVVVECKSTESPWVVMKDSFGEFGSIPMIQFGTGATLTLQNQRREGQLTEFCHKLNTFLKDRLPGAPSPGYGIAEAFKSSNGRDVSYASMQQVLSATRQDRTSSNYYGDDISDLCLDVFVPVIVTSSPLFEAALDDQSQKIATRAVERTAVRASATGAGGFTVHIFNEQALGQLIGDLRPVRREVEAFVSTFDRRVLKEDEESVADD
jgi:hypothetical protein